MVKVVLFALVIFAAHCAQPFVMKPKLYNKPVMVGQVRYIGGEKMPPDQAQATPFTTEIEILDTPTSSSNDWQLTQDEKLDHKLTAATALSARDAQISEFRFGSYVFNTVLFYFDKDWIRVSGYSVPKIFEEPERKYMLYVRPVGYKKDKKRKEKKTRTSRPRRRAR